MASDGCAFLGVEKTLAPGHTIDEFTHDFVERGFLRANGIDQLIRRALAPCSEPLLQQIGLFQHMCDCLVKRVEVNDDTRLAEGESLEQKRHAAAAETSNTAIPWERARRNPPGHLERRAIAQVIWCDEVRKRHGPVVTLPCRERNLLPSLHASHLKEVADMGATPHRARVRHKHREAGVVVDARDLDAVEDIARHQWSVRRYFSRTRDVKVTRRCGSVERRHSSPSFDVSPGDHRPR